MTIRFNPTKWPNIQGLIALNLEYLHRETTLQGEIKVLMEVRMLSLVGYPIVWVKKGKPPTQCWQTLLRFYDGFEIIPNDLSQMPSHRAN